MILITIPAIEIASQSRIDNQEKTSFRFNTLFPIVLSLLLFHQAPQEQSFDYPTAVESRILTVLNSASNFVIKSERVDTSFFMGSLKKLNDVTIRSSSLDCRDKDM